MNIIYLIGGLVVVKLFCSICRINKTSHKETKPLVHTKNKWLYLTDSFGKMEKGVVYESQTYEREITDSSIYSDFKIVETNDINGHIKLKNKFY